MKPVNFLSIALSSMWVCPVGCPIDYLDLICFDNYRFRPKIFMVYYIVAKIYRKKILFKKLYYEMGISI